jgi:hypothetical protein
MTRVGRALFAVDDAVPERFRRFDALIDQSGLTPDLEEYSAKMAPSLQPHRATHYFDVGRREPGLVRKVADLFARQAEAFGAPLSERFSSWLGALDDRVRDPVLQIVLGVDDRAVTAAARLKIYFVLQKSAEPFVREALEALGAAPGEVRLDLVYILGADFTAAGHGDTKLYFVLDRARVPRVAEPLPELFAGTRQVVLQHCLARPRRQMFFHLDNSELGWRALDEPLARRARAMGVVPWIFSYPLDGRRIELESKTVYFHTESPR